MAFLHKLEDQLAKPGALSRRVFLNGVTKSCAAFAALAAGLRAEDVHAYPYACCTLLYSFCASNSCPCSSSKNYTWTCRDSTTGCYYMCGECYGCNPPCSYAQEVCSQGCPCALGAPSIDAIAKFGPLRAVGEKCH